MSVLFSPGAADLLDPSRLSTPLVIFLFCLCLSLVRSQKTLTPVPFSLFLYPARTAGKQNQRPHTKDRMDASHVTRLLLQAAANATKAANATGAGGAAAKAAAASNHLGWQGGVVIGVLIVGIAIMVLDLVGPDLVFAAMSSIFVAARIIDIKQVRGGEREKSERERATASKNEENKKPTFFFLPPSLNLKKKKKKTLPPPSSPPDSPTLVCSPSSSYTV